MRLPGSLRRIIWPRQQSNAVAWQRIFSSRCWRTATGTFGRRQPRRWDAWAAIVRTRPSRAPATIRTGTWLPPHKWLSRRWVLQAIIKAMQDDGPKRKQFLLVDDDADCLATLTGLLKQMSKGQWAIRTATNHYQALEQLKGEPVDAVVLDVEMPVMDGIEFLRLLGRTHPGQQVVMLTGRVDETTRKTALDLGATLFLEKPTSGAGFQALYAALDALAGVGAQSGFRGVMQRVELQDVLQMECLN